MFLVWSVDRVHKLHKPELYCVSYVKKKLNGSFNLKYRGSVGKAILSRIECVLPSSVSQCLDPLNRVSVLGLGLEKVISFCFLGP